MAGQSANELEARLEAIVQTAVDGIITIDERGSVLTFNPGAERIFGYAADEVIGRNVSVLMPEPDRSAHDGYLARYLASGHRTVIGVGREVTGRHKDGRTIPIELAVSEMSVGGRRMFTGITRDISRRRRAENDLRRVMERTAVATRAARVGIWEWEIARDRLVVDDLMLELLGVPSVESPPNLDAWVSRVHSEDRAPFTAQMTRAAAERGAMDITFRVTPSDGAPRFLHASARTLCEAGEPPRMIGTTWDVTSLKLAELELERQNVELEAGSRLDRVGAAVMTAVTRAIDADPAVDVLRVLSEGATFRPLALYEYDEWAGALKLRAGLSLAPGSSERSMRLGQGLVGEAAARRTAQFVEASEENGLALDTGVGVLHPSVVFAMPLIHGEQLMGVLAGASFKPLTPRERDWLAHVATQIAVGMHALRQYGELKTLSAVLDERSKRIEAQNAELARANRMKSEFLASMSHELRTPLNAIIGFSELLKDGVAGALSEGQLDYVSEVFGAGQHLLSLINDILDLSKVEAGTMELDLCAVDLAEVASSALVIVRERAAKAEITVSLSVPAHVPQLLADPRRLRQVLYNLLSNAVKFTNRGGEVSVAVTGDDAEVEISVKDTGIGIEAADIPRLFKPFQQLDSGVDRRFEGTGLGLAMVKSIVELHGGRCGVESEPGKGSRFWVTLPGVSATHTRPRPASRAPAARSEPRAVAGAAPSSSPRILIVDDDPAALALASDWLASAGYQTEGVTDCESAWRIISEDRVDAIVLDLLFAQEPRGYECLKRLKESRHASVPIVIVSIVADERKGMALGAVEVLQKPVAGAELVRAIEDLGLRRAGARGTRMLVVDDDARAVEHVAARLEAGGFSVSRAFGGAQALELLRQGGIDGVVLDLMMPEVSGFAVLRELRSRDATAQLPVIVLTAKLLGAAERSELESVAHAVIVKSEWDGARFLRAIRESLDQAARPRASAGMTST